MENWSISTQIVYYLYAELWPGGLVNGQIFFWLQTEVNKLLNVRQHGIQPQFSVEECLVNKSWKTS